MVESSLDTHTYQFESDKVDSFAYVMDILKKDIDATIHMNFMNPIIEAFRSLKQA